MWATKSSRLDARLSMMLENTHFFHFFFFKKLNLIDHVVQNHECHLILRDICT